MSKEVILFLLFFAILDIGYIISIIKDKPFKFRTLYDADYNLIERTVNKMNGREFEIFCYKLFNLMGYKVEITPETVDGGKDLVLNKDIYVECKHWDYKSPAIGRPIAEKLIGSCAVDNIQNAIVVTTGKFHKNIYDYAQKINKTGKFTLKLLDMNDIMRMVKTIGTSEILREMGFSLDHWEANHYKEKI